MNKGASRILVRMPANMKKKLRLAAAMSNCSVNEQVILYLNDGLLKTQEKILNNPEKCIWTDEDEE